MLGEGSRTRGLALSGPPGKPWASRACAAAVLAVGGCLRRLLIVGKVQKPGGRSESQLRCCLHCCALHSPARFAKPGAGTKLPAVLSWANTRRAATGGAQGGGS